MLSEFSEAAKADFCRYILQKILLPFLTFAFNLSRENELGKFKKYIEMLLRICYNADRQKRYYQYREQNENPQCGNTEGFLFLFL